MLPSQAALPPSLLPVHLTEGDTSCVFQASWRGLPLLPGARRPAVSVFPPQGLHFLVLIFRVWARGLVRPLVCESVTRPPRLTLPGCSPAQSIELEDVKASFLFHHPASALYCWPVATRGNQRPLSAPRSSCSRPAPVGQPPPLAPPQPRLGGLCHPGSVALLLLSP